MLHERNLTRPSLSIRISISLEKISSAQIMTLYFREGVAIVSLEKDVHAERSMQK